MPTANADEFSPDNPLGTVGFEFVEFAAENPDQLAGELKRLGFRETAVHRSRPWIRLFRQGSMNCILNRKSDDEDEIALPGVTRVSAIAIQVADAGLAIRHAADQGAWTLPTHAGPMELVIPGIEGIGATSIFFIDRFGDRTIYEVDFVPCAGDTAADAATSGLVGFDRIVHQVAAGRAEECADYYRQVLGLVEDPRERTATRRLLRSPSGAIGIAMEETADDVELTQELAIRCADLEAAVGELRQRGVAFEPAPGGGFIDDLPGATERSPHHLRARLSPLSGGLRISLMQIVAVG